MHRGEIYSQFVSSMTAKFILYHLSHECICMIYGSFCYFLSDYIKFSIATRNQLDLDTKLYVLLIDEGRSLELLHDATI